MEESHLAVLGLGPDDHAVYSSVLGRPRSRVEEVVDDVLLPLATVHERLSWLRDRGLVSQAADDAETYVAVDPRDSLAAGADQVADELARLRALIPGWGARFDQVRRLAGTSPDPSGGSVLVSDPAEVAGWYARLQQRAREEFVVFDRPPYVSSPVEPLEEASMRRGVRVRALYVAESFERPGAWQEVLRLGALGEESRTVPSLPVKMAVADRRTLLMSLAVDGTAVEALVTSGTTLVTMMVELFEATWARGVALTAAAPDPAGHDAPPAAPTAPDLLDRDERHVVALIGSGATDEAIASRLGISPRSVRRRTQALMQRVGVESRFQLGVVAGRSGWL